MIVLFLSTNGIINFYHCTCERTYTDLTIVTVTVTVVKLIGKLVGYKLK